MNKVVLLLKRPLVEAEKDLLEKFCSVTYFNERVHTDKALNTLSTGSDVLVLPIYNDAVKYWYESQRTTVDPATMCIVLLEKTGVKCNKNRVYGEKFARKRIPSLAMNKGQMLSQLMSDHISSVRPWWKQILACVAHNI